MTTPPRRRGAATAVAFILLVGLLVTAVASSGGADPGRGSPPSAAPAAAPAAAPVPLNETAAGAAVNEATQRAFGRNAPQGWTPNSDGTWTVVVPDLPWAWDTGRDRGARYYQANTPTTVADRVQVAVGLLIAPADGPIPTRPDPTFVDDCTQTLWTDGYCGFRIVSTGGSQRGSLIPDQVTWTVSLMLPVDGQRADRNDATVTGVLVGVPAGVTPKPGAPEGFPDTPPPDAVRQP